MNKTELIATIANSADLSKKDAEKAVAARQQITIPTRQKDFSEDSDVNDMFNFTNLAMDLQLDEQLNAEELKEFLADSFKILETL